MECKFRRAIGFDSGNEAPVQNKLNRHIRTALSVLIPISQGISQSKSKITAESVIASIWTSVKFVIRRKKASNFDGVRVAYTFLQ
jgi:hypothetical protein